MTERQQEHGAGVLLALLVVGFLRGGWLLLPVMVHSRGSEGARSRQGWLVRWALRHALGP